MRSGVSISCLASALVISLAQLCSAQSTPASSPTFVAATIKPSDPNIASTESSMGWNRGGTFSAKSMSLEQLIEFAYDIGYFDVDQRIIGGPKWIGSTKFDVVAKCDDETTSALGNYV